MTHTAHAKKGPEHGAHDPDADESHDNELPSTARVGNDIAGEELNRLVRVTSTPAWLAVAVVVIIIAAAITWASVATVASTVTGEGLLIPGGRLDPVVSPTSGIVKALDVDVGDTVAAGATVATILNEQDDEVAVKADNAGSVAAIEAGPGAPVKAGSIVVSLEDPGAAFVAVSYFAQSEAGEIRTGLDARVRPTSLSDGLPAMLCLLGKRWDFECVS